LTIDDLISASALKKKTIAISKERQTIPADTRALAGTKNHGDGKPE